MARILAVWLLMRAAGSSLQEQPSSKPSGRHEESKASDASPMVAGSAIAGVVMKALNSLRPLAKSSHSSGSAMAMKPLPLVKVSRSCVSTCVDHQLRDAKAQPRHSGRPHSAGQPPSGRNCEVQPAGASGDHGVKQGA